MQFDASTTVEIVEGLRLDHFGDPDSVGIIEWSLQGSNDIRIPYGPGFGGNVSEPYPFVGNGLVASRVGRITPELFSETEIPLNVGAAMFRLDRQSNKTLVATWNGQVWIRN